MTAYIIRRVLWTIPVLWAIATITFFLMHAVPGGPFDRDKPLRPRSARTSNASTASTNRSSSSTSPTCKNLVQGDLGVSCADQRDGHHDHPRGLPVSVQLGVSAFIFATVFGVHDGSDRGAEPKRIGRLLRRFLRDGRQRDAQLHPRHVPGHHLLGQVRLDRRAGWEFGNPRKMILPMLRWACFPRPTSPASRAPACWKCLNQDYVRTARAKGLSEWRRHPAAHHQECAGARSSRSSARSSRCWSPARSSSRQTFAINGVGRHFVSVDHSPRLRRDHGHDAVLCR